MSPHRFRLAASCCLLFAFNVSAAFLYVDLNSTNSTPPYAGWSTAATNIQDAVDASAIGDSVLVTNGVYQTGGRVVYGALTNRVVLDKAITLQSVNGPAATFIQGFGQYSDDAVRCVYLTNGATLAGFTLAGGSTRSVSWPTPTPENCGGGVWCESVSAVVSNCVLVGNTAFFEGGAAYGGTLEFCTLTNNAASGGGGGDGCSLIHCTLIGNSASVGGGAISSTLNDCAVVLNNCPGFSSGGGGLSSCTASQCALLTNTAASGGAVSGGTLSNCSIIGNTALVEGGGVEFCSASNCTLIGNTVNSTTLGSGAVSGGGAYGATLNNCVISGNQVMNSLMGNNPTYGGGASGGVLNNCLVSGNTCKNGGGGAYNATLNNCTVVGNSDNPITGGAAYNCAVHNSILRFNGINYAGSSLNYCCTTPLPGGAGNIAADPLFVNRAGGDYHLQSGSLCINSGNNAYATNTTDLDANPRIKGGTVDIGAYEYQTPASILSYAWLSQYGLPADGTADFADPDHDGMNNWQEWRSGTNPTDASSVLKMASVVPATSPAGAVVTWQSASGITYYLQSSTNLSGQPAFSTLQSNIVGQAVLTAYTDSSATNNGPHFYRVGVQ